MDKMNKFPSEKEVYSHRYDIDIIKIAPPLHTVLV